MGRIPNRAAIAAVSQALLAAGRWKTFASWAVTATTLSAVAVLSVGTTGVRIGQATLADSSPGYRCRTLSRSRACWGAASWSPYGSPSLATPPGGRAFSSDGLVPAVGAVVPEPAEPAGKHPQRGAGGDRDPVVGDGLPQPAG